MTRKSAGPRNVPCGTPPFRIFQFDTQFQSILTHCLRSKRKLRIQFIIFDGTFIHGRKNHGGRGGSSPLTSKAGGLSPPKKDLSVPKLIHVFNGLQCYTCINPMIMVKLTSKGQKSMFERVKNRKKISGKRVPEPPSSTCVFIARRAPLTFFIFLRPCFHFV